MTMEQKMENPLILAIESSCDETSAAVLNGNVVLSNIIASQKIHEKYGGVVPELASRAHQANIVPVVDQALTEANVDIRKLNAIAFTQGPGLMGALLVGSSFAKSLSLALNIPLIAVHHMEAHVMAHYIKNDQDQYPEFPFLCLTVSGGHTQIVHVKSSSEFTIVGETIDDAAGEAFDKAAKVLGLPYPGGPLVDRYAASGDHTRFHFTTPQIKGYDFSFSGLKTNLLYFLREQKAADAGFIEREMSHICASYQHTITEYLIHKFFAAARELNIRDVALAGGVSANSELRRKFLEAAAMNHQRAFIPPFQYCTDNAAMIGISAWFKYRKEEFCDLKTVPAASMKL
jgi:N6-L-threonylcarbamoyladenine synthase